MQRHVGLYLVLFASLVVVVAVARQGQNRSMFEPAHNEDAPTAQEEQQNGAVVRARQVDGAYIHQGHAKMESGQFEEAIRDFDYVIERNPPDAELHMARAFARSQLDDIDGALADCDTALELARAVDDAEMIGTGLNLCAQITDEVATEPSIVTENEYPPDNQRMRSGGPVP